MTFDQILRAQISIPAVILLLALGCQTPVRQEPTVEFYPEKLQEMDAAILAAIDDGKAPGGVLWLERQGQTYTNALGHRAVEPTVEPMTMDTIFDAASLTKVVATTPSIMLLLERGAVELDAPVARYIPEFARNGKESITVRHLLTHSSGLRPGLSLRELWSGSEHAIELAGGQEPFAPPGERFRYSDINFILLGEIVRRASGKPLDEFSRQEIFEPLGMNDTGFHPPREKMERVAPTERLPEGVLRSVVHDPTSRRMGGVAGHAGLFITAADVAKYARMLLNQGRYAGTRIFKPETVALMTSVQSPPEMGHRRGLGWDIDSSYSRPRGKLFPLGSYGHTGWTGTSIWIDPFSETFLIFLSNRNHPTEDGSVLALREKLASLAAEAIQDYNFSFVPGALPPRVAPETPLGAADLPSETIPSTQALNGIDVLAKEQFAPLKDLRAGLITNHTGTDRNRKSTIDILKEAPDVNLVKLFSPEHGIRGVLDEKVGDSVDEKTGLTIYSLYGETRKPQPEHLQDIDAIVFDIQDIGCRFYTYISTMGLAMEAAAEANLKFFVLDRVNPITGVAVNGPVLIGDTTFVGFHPIAVRHGMTVGELAQMFKAEKNIDVDLTVIPVEGWKRGYWFDQTALPWINPSPNMRSLTEATLYPGVGLLETTAVSVGRGTDTPFELVGAPYIDDLALAQKLNESGLTGVRFVPIRFTPDASVFKDKECWGVSIILTDREKCDSINIGLTIAKYLHETYPDDFDLGRFNRLLSHPPTLEAIRQGKSIEEIRRTWRPQTEEFEERRKKYLMYE